MSHAGHHIVKCRCGNVLMQCKCMQPNKTVRIRPGACVCPKPFTFPAPDPLLMLDRTPPSNMQITVGGMTYHRKWMYGEQWWMYHMTDENRHQKDTTPRRFIRLGNSPLTDALNIIASYREKYGEME